MNATLGFFEGQRKLAREYYAVDPEFAESYAGKVAGAVGAAVPQLVAMRVPIAAVVGIGGQSFLHGWEDAENTAMRRGEKFDPNRAYAYATTMAALNTALTFLEFKMVLGPWKKGQSELLGDNLIKLFQSATGAGAVNAAQGGVNGFGTTAFGIEFRNPLDLERRWDDFTVGAGAGIVLGAGARVALGRVRSEGAPVSRSGELEKQYSLQVNPRADLSQPAKSNPPDADQANQTSNAPLRAAPEKGIAVDGEGIFSYAYLNGSQALKEAHDRFGGPQGLLRSASEAIGDDPASAYHGNDPKAAGYDEIASLRDFAQKSGLLLDARSVQKFSEQNALRGGAEHKVSVALPQDRVVKELNANLLATEAVYDYLTDIELSNHFFKDDVRLEGFYEKNRHFIIVTSQPFRRGIHPELGVMVEKLRLHGIESESPDGSTGIFVIHDGRAGDVWLIDVKPDNVVLEDGLDIRGNGAFFLKREYSEYREEWGFAK